MTLAACGNSAASGPSLDVQLVESLNMTRASIACRGPAAQLTLDPSMALYGVRPIEGHAVVSLVRRDGTAGCTVGETPAITRAAFRFRPMQIRAVAPTVVRDGSGARLVLTIDGQALGPRVAPDDGVYLVSRGKIHPADSACPEARYTDNRIVACVSAQAVAGLGPARVRVQSAGRLEEAAGAPIESLRLGRAEDGGTMRAGLVLVALGVALLAAPSQSEPGRPRAAEAYAERVVGAGLLEVAPSVPSSAELHSMVRGGRRRAAVGALDVASALPGALLARALGAAQQALVPATRALGGTLLSILCFCSIGGVFFARLSRRSGLAIGPGEALIATLALLFSTGILLGSRRADASLGATLVLLLMLDQLDAHQTAAPTPPRHFLQLGLLGATLVLAMPAYTSCALGLVLLNLLRRRRPGRALLGRALLGSLPIVAAMIFVRVWDSARALPPAPSSAPVHALFGLLLSPGRSLFIYSPVALLGLVGLPRLWARDRPRAQAILVALGTSLISIAGRADWHGEPSFGPTQLLLLVPLLVEPAALLLEVGRRAQLVFVATAALGLGIQVLGLGVRVEAWPRLMADVRASTGAPAWFLDPPADLEFVPQLTPVAGHALLLRAALGRPVPPVPPFSLVVGSDQAEVPKSQTIAAIWPAVWARFDKALLRPNLACIDAPALIAWIVRSLAIAWIAAGLFLLARGRADARREKWRRG